MIDIHHRIGVQSPSTDGVYDALTTIEGLAGWWTTDTAGDAALGGKLEFRFLPGGFDMEVIELMPLSDLGGKIDILMVRYAPEREVRMTAGENRGKVITYTNVVLSLDRLAEWDGADPLRVTVRPDGAADDRFPADTRHALLVQREHGGEGMPGPILAAIRLD